MITEESIRQRLSEDRRKPSRLASWEEVEFLLDRLDELRKRLAAVDQRVLHLYGSDNAVSVAASVHAIIAQEGE